MARAHGGGGFPRALPLLLLLPVLPRAAAEQGEPGGGRARPPVPPRYLPGIPRSRPGAPYPGGCSARCRRGSVPGAGGAPWVSL